MTSTSRSREIADRLKLNQQTVRNWIGPQDKLPAVPIGRRVRVRRVDLDHVLAQGATVEIEPQASTVAPADAIGAAAHRGHSSARAGCLTA